jgi:hypothetical protein
MKSLGIRIRQDAQLIILIVVGTVVVTTMYLWRSQTVFALGFPLDDAWIHQTYARNLATLGEWSFIPGHVSTGSTSPLWSLLLAAGYLLGISHLPYSYLLGSLVLACIGWLIGHQQYRRISDKPVLFAGLILILIFEWHLVWAALSGMETLCLGLHILVIVYGLEHDWDPLLLGGIAGLGIWIRPDALLALIPIGWSVLVQHRELNISFKKSIKYLLGFFLLMAPYLFMNFQLGGEWWPSTFYAKQLEYAVLQQESVLTRLLRMASAPLIGVGVLLLPGVMIQTWEEIRSRRWVRLAGILWIISFVMIYALRLPVAYQHGRYMIPVIPALFLLGYEGLITAIQQENGSFLRRILNRTWLLSLMVITLIFSIKGAEAYAKDVAIIESEMVATARWIESHTDEDDLIAAHDIGALGYFGNREILDLAGLISPEVIPIIRDEPALRRYIMAEDARYLMTFPGWYPALTADREIVFSTGAMMSPSLGGENMTVYSWP